MHANIEQLLEIKDGLENEASAHLESCEQCQAELRALQSLQSAMFSSADAVPPTRVFDRIQASLAAQNDAEVSTAPLSLVAAAAGPAASTGIRWGSLNTAIYTLALSILVTGLIGFYSLNNQQTAAFYQAEELQASIEQLMLNSRGLESVLQRVKAQDNGLTPAERDVADRLYWRLMYVDQMIHESNREDQQDPQKIQVLWGDRVNALTELNQLYHGGPTNVGDPEI